MPPEPVAWSGVSLDGGTAHGTAGAEVIGAEVVEAEIVDVGLEGEFVVADWMEDAA